MILHFSFSLFCYRNQELSRASGPISSLSAGVCRSEVAEVRRRGSL
jgi:hypothetical protein